MSVLDPDEGAHVVTENALTLTCTCTWTKTVESEIQAKSIKDRHEWLNGVRPVE